MKPTKQLGTLLMIAAAAGVLLPAASAAGDQGNDQQQRSESDFHCGPVAVSLVVYRITRGAAGKPR